MVQLSRSLTQLSLTANNNDLMSDCQQESHNGTYDVSLYDHVHNEILFVRISNLGILASECKKTVSLISDKMRNSIIGKVLTRLLGTNYEKCEKRFMVCDKGKIIATIVIDYLKSSLKLRANKKYLWIIHEGRDFPNTHSSNTNNTAMTDMLTSYGIGMTCEEDLLSTYIHVNRCTPSNSDPITRLSLPCGM